MKRPVAARDRDVGCARLGFRDDRVAKRSDRRRVREDRVRVADERRPQPVFVPARVRVAGRHRDDHRQAQSLHWRSHHCYGVLTRACSPLFHQLRHDTPPPHMPRLAFSEIVSELSRVLVALGFADDRARASATLFAETHRDGVATHGLNRFPRFVRQIKAGRVKPDGVARRGRPLRTLGAVGRAARSRET